ncbi:MAG: hypothetical protein GF418_14935, partial [Chitinivibrionales bacterium]|nr:hypothetical protein [Chitinivibrionales bacterium]MBD3396915.1 hypothetical protein [Chitinivibrionales bacterium]
MSWYPRIRFLRRVTAEQKNHSTDFPDKVEQTTHTMHAVDRLRRLVNKKALRRGLFQTLCVFAGIAFLNGLVKPIILSEGSEVLFLKRVTADVLCYFSGLLALSLALNYGIHVFTFRKRSLSRLFIADRKTFTPLLIRVTFPAFHILGALLQTGFDRFKPFFILAIVALIAFRKIVSIRRLARGRLGAWHRTWWTRIKGRMSLTNALLAVFLLLFV